MFFGRFQNLCFPRPQKPEQQRHHGGWQPRIFAAYPCCACFVAGEPGGGSVSRRGVGGCAAGGCVEVRGGGGQGRGCRRRAAVGEGMRYPKRLADDGVTQ